MKLQSAALEHGLFAGGTSGGKNQNNPTQTATFVTAVLKSNGTTEFAIKGGNATSGSLTTHYKGVLPGGWSPPNSAQTFEAARSIS